MDDDFKDVLSIFNDDKDKNANPPAEEAKLAEAQNPAEAVNPASATGGVKKTLPGKGLQRPQPGGKFQRPATGTSPAPAGKASPPSPAATQTPGPVHAAVPPPPAPVTPAAAFPAPALKAGNSLQSILLVVLTLLSLVSLMVGAGALAKVSGMRAEMRLLNENMKAVRISADRSWQIKCGVFVPVPNQRPQEYMIKYEEKDGQLIKKNMIIRPIE